MMEWVALFLGIAATAISIVSGITTLYYARRDRLLLLKVRPGFWFALDGKDSGILISVLNLSTFPVEITNVGFSVRNSDDLMIWKPSLSDPNFELPKKLEPRETYAYRFPEQFLQEGDFSVVTEACVYTSTGEFRKGSSPYLKKIVTEAKHKKLISHEGSEENTE